MKGKMENLLNEMCLCLYGDDSAGGGRVSHPGGSKLHCTLRKGHVQLTNNTSEFELFAKSFI